MCFSKQIEMNFTMVWNESFNETFGNASYEDYPTEEEVRELYRKYDKNQAVSDSAYWCLIVAYAILIVLGCFGNLLVIIAVAGNRSKLKNMRKKAKK